MLGSNGTQVGHLEDVEILNDVNDLIQLGDVVTIRLLPVEDNGVFNVTTIMLQLFQMKGTYEGLAHEDPMSIFKNVVDICCPFWFKNISQESICLQLPLLSFRGESTKWLVDLSKNSVTTWDELTTMFYVSLFPPSNMIKVRDNIKSFKGFEGEQIHET